MDYQKEMTYSASPDVLFEAITQKLEQWWGKTDRGVDQVGDEFKTSFGNAFWKFRIAEFSPNKEVVWECIDGQPEFEHEWVGTKLHWNISPAENGTQLSFTHKGLTPAFECYDVCAPTWDMFLSSSLKKLCGDREGDAAPLKVSCKNSRKAKNATDSQYK